MFCRGSFVPSRDFVAVVNSPGRVIMKKSNIRSMSERYRKCVYKPAIIERLGL